jgi:hypothetical protein
MYCRETAITSCKPRLSLARRVRLANSLKRIEAKMTAIIRAIIEVIDAKENEYHRHQIAAK